MPCLHGTQGPHYCCRPSPIYGLHTFKAIIGKLGLSPSWFHLRCSRTAFAHLKGAVELELPLAQMLKVLQQLVLNCEPPVL